MAEPFSFTSPPPPSPQQLAMMDAAAQGIAANSEALNMIHQAIAQPVGQLINDNKLALRKVDSRPGKVASGLLSRNSQVIGDIHETIGQIVANLTGSNATSLTSIGAAAATGGAAMPGAALPRGIQAPHLPPMPAPPPPSPLGSPLGNFWVWYDKANCSFVINQVAQHPPIAGIPNPFTSFGAADAWVIDHGTLWVANNFPPCVPGGSSTLAVPAAGNLPAGTPPASGDIWRYAYQCGGVDGQPSWATWVQTALGASGFGISCPAGVNAGMGNFNSGQQYTLSAQTFASCADASAAAQAGFAAFVATCGGSTPPPVIPPPGLPPPPPVIPPPAPVPPPPAPPPPGDTCPPCPTPPPADQPSCDVTAKCTLEQLPQAAPGLSQCDSWKTMIDSLVYAGNSIIQSMGDNGDGGALIMGEMRHLLSCLGDNFSIPEVVWAKFCKCYDREKSCSILGMWGKAIAPFIADDFKRKDLYALLAVRAVLESLQDVSIDVATSTSSQGEISSQLGLTINIASL